MMCPAIDKTAIFVPTGLTSQLVQVTGDSYCIAELTTVADGNPPIFVQNLLLTAGETSVCQIHGTLSDGTQVAATLTFKPVVKNCCDAFDTVASPFTPVDGGAADGG
jgi:hypothetical protein